VDSSRQLDVLRGALRLMGYERDHPGPRPLRISLDAAATAEGLTATTRDLDEITAGIVTDDVNAPPRLHFTEYVHQWDHADATWAKTGGGIRASAVC